MWIDSNSQDRKSSLFPNELASLRRKLEEQKMLQRYSAVSIHRVARACLHFPPWFSFEGKGIILLSQWHKSIQSGGANLTLWLHGWASAQHQPMGRNSASNPDHRDWFRIGTSPLRDSPRPFSDSTGEKLSSLLPGLLSWQDMSLDAGGRLCHCLGTAF